MPDPAAELQAEILGEIHARGPIPFARFMELCLYHPRLGYYTRGIGGGGGRDYITSSGLHAAFGGLVARQAEEMWRLCGRPAPFHFVELGPGEGLFARDLLDAAAGVPDLAAALRCLLIERSPSLSERQRARLAGRPGIPIAWRSFEEVEADGPLTGCLFANEVLDAFPVHRVIGTAGGPREVHVTERGGRFEEILWPLSTEEIDRFLAEAGVVPEEGQEVDVNLEAPRFVTRALRLLSRGYLVLIDYGYEEHELYHPARRRGTLRAIYHHRVSEEYLVRPGDQDLTAHVDFTAVRRAAERAGGRCLGLTTQARFLLALGAIEFFGEQGLPGDGLRVEGPAARVRRFREREALKELVLPDRMGERFRVMVLAAGEAPGNITGLLPPWASPAQAARFAAPALSPALQAQSRS